MKIHEWQTASGKNEIKSYFDDLPEYEQAEYRSIRKAILNYGYSAFQYLNTRQLKGKLWEIKFSQNRIMYVIADSDNVYFLHACKKQKLKRLT